GWGGGREHRDPEQQRPQHERDLDAIERRLRRAGECGAGGRGRHPRSRANAARAANPNPITSESRMVLPTLPDTFLTAGACTVSSVSAVAGLVLPKTDSRGDSASITADATRCASAAVGKSVWIVNKRLLGTLEALTRDRRSSIVREVSAVREGTRCPFRWAPRWKRRSERKPRNRQGKEISE